MQRTHYAGCFNKTHVQNNWETEKGLPNPTQFGAFKFSFIFTSVKNTSVTYFANAKQNQPPQNLKTFFYISGYILRINSLKWNY